MYALTPPPDAEKALYFLSIVSIAITLFMFLRLRRYVRDLFDSYEVVISLTAATFSFMAERGLLEDFQEHSENLNLQISVGRGKGGEVRLELKPKKPPVPKNRVIR